MDFLLIRSAIGMDYRVTRKGFHFVVETRRPHGVWETAHKTQILNDTDAVPALRAAIRRCFLMAEDIDQVGIVARILEVESDMPKNPFLAIKKSNRDDDLHIRITSKLKNRLRKDAREIERSTGIDITLSDYVIYRLGGGGGDLN